MAELCLRCGICRPFSLAKLKYTGLEKDLILPQDSAETMVLLALRSSLLIEGKNKVLKCFLCMYFLLLKFPTVGFVFSFERLKYVRPRLSSNHCKL